MKTATRISIETNTNYYLLCKLIETEKIIPNHKRGKFKYYDEFQENLILNLLQKYHNKPIFQIFESKMNNL